jgi:hypothetical protein
MLYTTVSALGVNSIVSTGTLLYRGTQRFELPDAGSRANPMQPSFAKPVGSCLQMRLQPCTASAAGMKASASSPFASSKKGPFVLGTVFTCSGLHTAQAVLPFRCFTLGTARVGQVGSQQPINAQNDSKALICNKRSVWIASRCIVFLAKGQHLMRC